MNTNAPALPVTARVTLANGSLLSAKNAPRIVARDTEPSDPMGNQLPSPLFRYKDTPPYFRRWAIKKEKKGFIFREVNNNAGICGHANTVRELVIKTLCGFSSGSIVVEVLQESEAAA